MRRVRDRPGAGDGGSPPTRPSAFRRWWGLALGAWVGMALQAPLGAPAGAQDAPGGSDGDPAEELRITADAVELSIGGRVQTQLSTTTASGFPTSRLFFRRARLEVSVRVSERIRGTIQPDFAGDRASLADAYLLIALDPGLELLAGRAYRPFGLLEQTSSKRILPVERGLRIAGVDAADQYALGSDLGYSDRDLGVQLRGAPEGAPLGLAYAAGVFRGPLHGRVGERDSYQAAGRVTVRPADRWTVGAGWSGRDFARETAEGWETRRGHAFEVDLEYGSFAPGWHLLAEASTGDLDAFADASYRGAHVWLAYRTEPTGVFGTAFEPLMRLSVAETTGEDASAVGPAGGTLVTPGLNLYLDPLNRIMINVDVWRSEDGIDAESFKLMFQLAF